jgi:aminopeptidase N
VKHKIHSCAALALAIVPAIMTAQVLFPGNSSERRSRTYDVLHYKLVVGFDEEARRVNGTTSITLTPLCDTLDSVELDAETMDIYSVVLPSGKTLRFTNRSPKIAVLFDEPLRTEDTVTISIRYSCTPRNGLFFIQPDSTNPLLRRQIWSQGEDTDNHFWFPCYDYPNDKATSEVIATVRDSYVLLSNGKLIGTHHDPLKQTTTFHWFESRPHSSYLIMIAAGEYEVVRDTCHNIPLEYYVFKNDIENGVMSLASTPAAMKFFEKKIGIPYPWEKYAQIWISHFMWGGMENTSAVTMNDAAYLLDERAAVDFSSTDVVAHELAHQWWGDLVTSRDWSNLWLHEGFANYFEALFKLDQKGGDYFQYDLMQQASSVMRAEDAYGRSPLVGKDGYTANVYSKGCWVLHMMKNVLGERGFWKAVKHFGQRYSYGNADSYEFMLAIEDATGQNLDWFFNQWVYKSGYPKVQVTRSWDENSKSLTLNLDQTQVIDSATGPFRFPLTIAFTSSGG